MENAGNNSREHLTGLATKGQEGLSRVKQIVAQSDPSIPSD